MIPKGSKHVAG